MMKHYEVTVTVHGATPPKGHKPVIAIGFIVKTDSPEDAKVKALDCAKMSKQKHPRRYKNATFSVADENVRIFI